ncbi:MAG: hypothetical protein KDK23_12050 [Leptospiraceae bacterium]|nr:hypothetical protein [Leptospiraceae bacterium]
MPARIQKAIRRLTDHQKKIQGRFRLISIFRTATFFLSAISIFVFVPGEVHLLPSLPGWVLFLLLVRIHGRLRRKSNGCQNRIQFYLAWENRLVRWTGSEKGDLSHSEGRSAGSNTSTVTESEASQSDMADSRAEESNQTLQSATESEAEELAQVNRDLLLTGSYSLLGFLNLGRLGGGSRTLHRWIQEAVDGPPGPILRERQARMAGLSSLQVLQGRWFSHAPSPEEPASAIREERQRGAMESMAPASFLYRQSRSRTNEDRLPGVPDWLALVAATLAIFSLVAFFSHEILGTRAYHFLTFPAQWIFFGIYLLFFRNPRARKRFDELLAGLDETLPLLKELKGFRFHNPALAEENTLNQQLKHQLREAIFQDSVYSLFRNPLAFAMGGLIFSGPVLADWSMGRFLNRSQQQIEHWLDQFAQLDALFCMAAHFRFSSPRCLPEIVGEEFPLISARDLHHPLLAGSESVGNDVDFRKEDRLWIITGSNMGGKSTFLRTLGMNLILAQMGGGVRAREFRFRSTPLATSMQIQDNLARSESLFYAEVRSLKRLLDRPVPLVFFLDEMLKGTNQKDRSFACKRILSYLIENGASGFLTTHDMELTSLKEDYGEKVQLYHFRESPGEGLKFDFKLHPGSVEGTTALAILRKEGLPV